MPSASPKEPAKPMTLNLKTDLWAINKWNKLCRHWAMLWKCFANYGTPTTTPLTPLNICCFNWSASSSGQTSCESCVTAWGFCRLCVPNWGIAPALRSIDTHGTSRTTADKTRIWNRVPDDAPQPSFPISMCPLVEKQEGFGIHRDT